MFYGYCLSVEEFVRDFYGETKDPISLCVRLSHFSTARSANLPVRNIEIPSWGIHNTLDVVYVSSQVLLGKIVGFSMEDSLTSKQSKKLPRMDYHVCLRGKKPKIHLLSENFDLD